MEQLGNAQNAMFEQSNVIIENRARASVSGVTDVISFDDESVILETTLGPLVLHGRDFKINKLNVDIGELEIDGQIDDFAYQVAEKEKPSLLNRLFK
ncbi:MAG: sporulation protein YabP [Clostridiales bacterium]|jgi:sporulation protein YabP|nr:sporulation protein YabP [Clostridiales bacterium]